MHENSTIGSLKSFLDECKALFEVVVDVHLWQVEYLHVAVYELYL